MTGSSNFLRFDPNLTDTVSDNDYALNGQRLNGLQTGLAPTALHNKFYAQQSSMTAAIGQVLAAQGFTISDSDYPGLVSALTQVIGAAATAIFPQAYNTGPQPFYNAPTSLIIPTGNSIRSADNTVTITVPSDLTVNLNVSGANGLDTGVKTANSWYYLYLIRKSIDGTVSGLFSLVNESVSGSITLPPGYDQKAQTRTVWSTDSASNIRYSRVVQSLQDGAVMMYNDTIPSDGSTGPLTVLSNGVASSYTTVSCSRFIPPNCLTGLFRTVLTANGSGCVGNMRTTGFTNDGVRLIAFTNTTNRFAQSVYDGPYQVSSSQQIDYKLTEFFGYMSIDVTGFILTGIK